MSEDTKSVLYFVGTLLCFAGWGVLLALGV